MFLIFSYLTKQQKPSVLMESHANFIKKINLVLCRIENILNSRIEIHI